MMAAVAVAAVAIALVWEVVRPRPLRGQRFALIGAMDIDRDGRDDRAALTSIIEKAGGSVEFDMPPSGAARGAIAGTTSWYVLDEPGQRAGRPAVELAAVKTARDVGARPTSLQKLIRRASGR